MHISGRDREVKKLDEFYSSNKSEFMAIYGRRRVGKTYLVKQYFKKTDCDFFSATGLDDASFKLQRMAFCSELSQQLFNGLPIETPKAGLKYLSCWIRLSIIAQRKNLLFSLMNCPGW